jgi:hypothetical protein
MDWSTSSKSYNALSSEAAAGCACVWVRVYGCSMLEVCVVCVLRCITLCLLCAGGGENTVGQ